MSSTRVFKIPNKIKRQEQHLKIKKLKESTKRDDRLRRRRQEDKNPTLRDQRRQKNVPATIDAKRTWDDVDDGAEGELGKSFDVLRKKRKIEEELGDDDVEEIEQLEEEAAAGEDDKDEVDSMLGSDSDEDQDEPTSASIERAPSEAPSNAPSVATTADLSLTPESLMNRFPHLFSLPSDYTPKVLITTSLNSTLHEEAKSLVTFFPNSSYIPRSAHKHGYKYSVKEIAKYAMRRGYTHVVVLNEHLHKKQPSGMDVVCLPPAVDEEAPESNTAEEKLPETIEGQEGDGDQESRPQIQRLPGPTFHFSITNWVPGSRIPGHGNPTSHDPELILNGFRTPLGLLAAHMFKSLFPPPTTVGRQVVTLHNQRDYIFVRRHRYVFRERRTTEKKIQGTDGKIMAGAEDLRAGLQELGPRFTLKLRRVDKSVQRRDGAGQEWEWKAHDEKVRTRFSL